MSEEIEVIEGQAVEEQDDVKAVLASKTREELEQSIQQWYENSLALQSVQDALSDELRQALILLKAYQRSMAIADLPDPNYVETRNLLTKYGLVTETPSKHFRIFVDGVDITEHPDSREATAEEVEDLHLTSEEMYGTTTVELVQSEDGRLHVLPVKSDRAPNVDPFADMGEPPHE